MTRRIFDLGTTTWGEWFTSRPGPFISEERARSSSWIAHWLHEPESWSSAYGEQNRLLLRPGIEYRFLDCTIHSLVNISMKLSLIIVTDVKIKLFLPSIWRHRRGLVAVKLVGFTPWPFNAHSVGVGVGPIALRMFWRRHKSPTDRSLDVRPIA